MPCTESTRARSSGGRLPLNSATAALHSDSINTHSSIEPSWLPLTIHQFLRALNGTPGLIRWCRDQGRDYRLRLKGNLIARIGTRTTTSPSLAALMSRMSCSPASG